jgi:hypothetical protein
MDCALSDYITFGLRLVQLDASHSMFILLKHTKGKCECHVRVLASVTMAFRWITPGPALSYFLVFSEFLRIYLCQVFCIYIVQNLCVHLRLTTSVDSVLVLWLWQRISAPNVTNANQLAIMDSMQPSIALSLHLLQMEQGEPMEFTHQL